MVTAELLAAKFQSLLGSKYCLRVNHAFEQEFTKPDMTPYGATRNIAYSAFDKYSNLIVAVVTTQPKQLVSTPYRLDTSMYAVDFWLPVDFVKYDKDGQLLEAPKFDFYGDAERLAAAVKNTQLTFTDGDADYKAYLTMSEPTQQSGGLDNSGAYKRVVMRVSGDISLADPKLKTGDDVEVGLIIEGVERKFKNISNFSLSSTTDANAVLNAGALGGRQEPAQTGQAIDFEVDDYDVVNDPALKLLQDKVWENIDELTPTAATQENKLKVQVCLYKGGVLMREFWGVLSAVYRVSNKAGYGKYSVSIANSED